MVHMVGHIFNPVKFFVLIENDANPTVTRGRAHWVRTDERLKRLGLIVLTYPPKALEKTKSDSSSTLRENLLRPITISAFYRKWNGVRDKKSLTKAL